MNLLRKTSTLLKLNRMIGSIRLKFLYVFLADVMGWRYSIVRLDPVIACNLRCRMCSHSDAEWLSNQTRERFSREDLERLAAQFFHQALQVHVGCGAEPTIYKGFIEIVRLAKAHGVPHVTLVTNGQALRDEQVVQLVEAGLNEFVISSHGARAETYERMMVGASFERHLDCLRAVAGVCAAGGAELRINFTVCAENLEDLAVVAQRYACFGLSTLQVRPITPLEAAQQRNALSPEQIVRYRQLVAELHTQCRSHGIQLLANVDDPSHGRANPAASIYIVGALRLISPTMVWRPGFDFRCQDVAEFKRSSGFRRELLAHVLHPRRSASPSALASSTVFD
ncbi:radical SAM protein [Magnetospirillum molischianum]|uniref:Radical SAM core domain-containing protein n=1 Tax=Magnetospirillum molischianum DSM 120 TaxID=1150626 RepID=H8FXH5_MAGML|nr:radical SAM protein [Magnetospirillum molischianum]CCG43063.1 conserved hypothetical protein [Magnetospirillum molischianum DSM 120]